MANTAGGPYHQGGHQEGQYHGYGQAGTYYGMGQQHQQQASGYNYFGHVPPSQSQMGYGAGSQLHQQPSYPGQPHNINAYGMHQPIAPPPPPPPPPGESIASTDNSTTSRPPNSLIKIDDVPPLQPPPLPPMFPWMSAALAESMTSSRYAKEFEEQASNLPFVPIIVNDKDLVKMTENVIKEAEEVKGHQLQYYKDVLNQDLPKPLIDMFQPLYCKLCILTLSSPVVAKDHYSGRRHKKAIEAWFIKHPEHSTQRRKFQSANNANFSEVGHNNSTIVGCETEKPALINGFITNRQSLMSKNITAPPPPSISKSNTPTQGPPSLVSGLIGQQQRFDRKRPNAPPPAPSLTSPPVAKPLNIPQNNQQQQAKETAKESVQPHPKPMAPTLNKPQISDQSPKRTPTAVTVGGSINDKLLKIAQQSNQGPPPANPSNNTLPSSSKSQEPPHQKKAKLDGNESLPEHLRPPKKNFTVGHGGVKGVCRVCNVRLSSPVQAEQHFKGKTHLTRLQAFKDEGIEPPPPILPPPPPPKPQLPLEDEPVPSNVPASSFSQHERPPPPSSIQNIGNGGGNIGQTNFNQFNPNNFNNNRKNNFNNQRQNNFGSNRFKRDSGNNPRFNRN